MKKYIGTSAYVSEWTAREREKEKRLDETCLCTTRIIIIYVGHACGGYCDINIIVMMPVWRVLW